MRSMFLKIKWESSFLFLSKFFFVLQVNVLTSVNIVTKVLQQLYLWKLTHISILERNLTSVHTVPRHLQRQVNLGDTLWHIQSNVHLLVIIAQSRLTDQVRSRRLTAVFSFVVSMLQAWHKAKVVDVPWIHKG